MQALPVSAARPVSHPKALPLATDIQVDEARSSAAGFARSTASGHTRSLVFFFVLSIIVASSFVVPEPSVRRRHDFTLHRRCLG